MWAPLVSLERHNMPYRIWNTTKKPGGTGRNRNGYTIHIGGRTIYNGSSAIAPDELWLLIEKKMTELAAIGDVKIDILGAAKTPENQKTLDTMVAEERARAKERAVEVAPAAGGKVTQTGYESQQHAAGYDPNRDEDDLPFADIPGHDDSDAIVPKDNFTVTAHSEDSIGKKQKRR
jgi:hypothetical protein